jgi:hypothetical protein
MPGMSVEQMNVVDNRHCFHLKKVNAAFAFLLFFALFLSGNGLYVSIMREISCAFLIL